MQFDTAPKASWLNDYDILASLDYADLLFHCDSAFDFYIGDSNHDKRLLAGHS